MDDDEILACVAEALGLRPDGGSVAPLSGKQGLFVCRVCLPGARPYIFKAVRESCRRELRLSDLLSRVAPYAVPAVLHAAEDDRRALYWLLMRDEGAARLSDRPTREGYVHAASTLARLQIDALNVPDELSAIGLRTIDPAGWEEIALGVLAALEEGTLCHVAEPKSLTASLWRSGDLAADAAALPLTLVHGDLHAGNIALQDDGGVRLLDWGSAYVGPAFLGLAELLWPAERYARQLGEMGPVRKAYLDAWTPLVGKPGRLAPAIAACEALARLSLVQEALRRPERFGPFGASTMASHFIESCRHWERTKTC